MRAIVIDDKGVRLDPRRDDPQLAPGEAMIRPLRMGICATDLELCKGYMGFHGVIGHEFVGIVEEVRGGRRKIDGKNPQSWVGKRVVGSINCVCGRCEMCKAGLREHCRERTVLGIAGRDGCFAERFVLPVSNLFQVPEHVDDDQATFVEPLAAAYQILRQLTIEGRPYITVLGDGRLGLLCAQVLSQSNATVRLVGKHAAKLALCERWGVQHREVDDVGLRQDQDIVVDCTASPTGLPLALQMVRPRGTIVMKTTIAPDPKRPMIDLSPIVIHEINVVGSRCGPFPDAIEALSAGKIDVVSLISRRAKLAEGVEALRAAAKSGVIKVLIEP